MEIICSFRKLITSEIGPRKYGSFSVAFNITNSSWFRFYHIDERKWEFSSFYDIFLSFICLHGTGTFCGRKREKFVLLYIIFVIRITPPSHVKNHAPCSSSYVKLLYSGQFALSVWETNFSKIENRSYITASRLNDQWTYCLGFFFYRRMNIQKKICLILICSIPLLKGTYIFYCMI